MLFKKKKEIIVKENSTLMDLAMLLIGASIYALAFNLFLLPNNIVVGFSGLSVITNNLFGIKPSLFLMISYVIVLIFSFIFLGFQSTKRSIIGSILYPLLVEATSYLVPYIDISNIISEETENLDEYSRNAFNIIQQVHLGHFFNTVWHSL